MLKNVYQRKKVKCMLVNVCIRVWNLAHRKCMKRHSKITDTLFHAMLFSYNDCIPVIFFLKLCPEFNVCWKDGLKDVCEYWCCELFYSDKWHGVQEYSLEHWALKKRFKPFRYLLSQAENAGLHWNCLLERNFSWTIKFWVRV